MGRSTRVVNMSVDESLYEGVDRLARAKGTSRSQVLREALKQYVVAETRWSELLRWGEESAVHMGGLDESGVERIIHEYREERR